MEVNREEKKYLYKGFHYVERLETSVKGIDRVYERLGIGSAVAAIVTDAEGKIALVKQYRPCPDSVMHEMPAGLKDKDGLSDSEVLIEELEEECGIDRSEISYFSDGPIHSYFMLAGSSNASMSLYRVKLSTVQHTHEVDDRDVDLVEWLTHEEFEKLASEGELKDPETVMAYMMMKGGLL